MPGADSTGSHPQPSRKETNGMNTRQWLTVALTLSLMSWSAGVASAQLKPAEQSRGKTQTVDKATPSLMKMTGKVIAVDEKGKTMKLSSQGKEITVDVSQLKVLPKAGDVVDITYTQNAGKPPKALSSGMNSSRSNIN
jgi:hypothetical protein